MSMPLPLQENENKPNEAVTSRSIAKSEGEIEDNVEEYFEPGAALISQPKPSEEGIEIDLTIGKNFDQDLRRL